MKYLNCFKNLKKNDHIFVASLSSILQSNWNQIVDSFDEMNLRETLLRGIYAYGFEKPSAIQQRAIIPCIKGEFSSPFHTSNVSATANDTV